MFSDTQNDIQSKIKKLQQHLTENELALPLYVRFRTPKQNFVLQVNKIITDDIKGIKIYNGNPEAFTKEFSLEEITGIDALSDSKRIPFFLNDLNEPNEIKALADDTNYT
ncbi:MAG: hypothetical protein ACYDEE_06200 [Ignavibacteriaceae bacterium]